MGKESSSSFPVHFVLTADVINLVTLCMQKFIINLKKKVVKTGKTGNSY